MEMDITQLAKGLTEFLAPFLPYLVEGTKIAAKAAIAKFGEDAWKKAKEVWGKLKPKVEASPSAQRAIENAKVNEIEKDKGNPNDPGVLIKLEALFERVLEEDEAFARFVKAGDYSVVIDGNMNESIVVNGDENLVASHGGQINQTINKLIKKSKNLKISVAYPKLLSKRFESSFLLHVYLPEERSHVTRNIRSEFRKQKTNEQLQSSSIRLGQKIKLKLFNPAFDFPESVTKLIDNPVNKITFLGMPKDNCKPGFHKVLISISDADTEQEFESFAIGVRVVDFAFDHVSRPTLSRVSAIVLGAGSFVMVILTSLEQIDKTVGLTSGTAAGVLALGIYAGFYNLYRRIRPNTP